MYLLLSQPSWRLLYSLDQFRHLLTENLLNNNYIITIALEIEGAVLNRVLETLSFNQVRGAGNKSLRSSGPALFQKAGSWLASLSGAASAPPPGLALALAGGRSGSGCARPARRQDLPGGTECISRSGFLIQLPVLVHYLWLFDIDHHYLFKTCFYEKSIF